MKKDSVQAPRHPRQRDFRRKSKQLCRMGLSHISISIDSTRFMTGIGYNCAVEAWEEGKGVKAKYTNSKGVSSKMINARITSIQAHFMAYELKLIGQSEEETPSQPVKVKNIFDHLKEFVQEQRVACQWAYATVQCWTTFTHHFECITPTNLMGFLM